jgi:DnaJ-class molecular chaperone
MDTEDERAPWQTLGVRKGASFDEIKSAYRRRVLEVHPDKNRDIGSTKRFIDVRKAFESLRDGTYQDDSPDSEAEMLTGGGSLADSFRRVYEEALKDAGLFGFVDNLENLAPLLGECLGLTGRLN